MESPTRTYRESDELFEQVKQACAYFGITVGGDIVKHHRELVKRYEHALRAERVAGEVEIEFLAEARRRGYVRMKP